MLRALSIAWGWPALAAHELRAVTFDRQDGEWRKFLRARCEESPYLFLFDGLDTLKGWVPHCVHQKAIIGGDSIVPEISAASVIAKVSRDEWMTLLHHIYPDYGFASHKGYASSSHRNVIKKTGRTPLHRESFSVT
jgi:ribonuclease HII